MLKCNEILLNLIQKTKELLQIANEGDLNRDDDSCGVLFGITRDNCYKIIEKANNEIKSHKEKNKWR